MGKPGFSILLLKWQSVATKVTAPLPSPPPLGEGVRLLPPAGGGWEGGWGAACAEAEGIGSRSLC